MWLKVKEICSLSETRFMYAELCFCIIFSKFCFGDWRNLEKASNVRDRFFFCLTFYLDIISCRKIARNVQSIPIYFHPGTPKLRNEAVTAAIVKFRNKCPIGK